MDHKPWLWRKKSSEKTIVVSDKLNLSLRGNEVETLATNKAAERSMNLNEKLSSALSDCNAKDDLVTKHAKVAEEAIAGWEKAEAEALSLKQELDEALQKRVSAEERLGQMDAALKECMQQLRFVREEQEQRIHDAVMKTTREFEKAQMVLNEKMTEISRRLAKLGVENTQLSKALEVKENLIKDLREQKSKEEVDFNTLMARLDSTEKDNVSLKYEVRMLEKELEIRNEEKDFNRQSADASHKQNLESVKKIAKLESECQRLRLLVRKRLPGPAALAKMKNEVEILGRDSADMRRKKLNPPVAGLMLKDFATDNSLDTPSKRINLLTERLCAMEEENKTLKETLTKKNNELQSSRIMSARTASKLSQVESQLGELSKGRTTMELARSSPISHELSLTSIPDVGNDDEVSSAETWASALISELEHFRYGKQKGPPPSTVVSDISLMDDFVEMEKLAIVSVDKSFGSLHMSSNEGNSRVTLLENGLHAYPSEATGRELVPVTDSHSDFNDTNRRIQSKDISIGKFPSWLQDILRVIFEQNHVTQRSPYEILEEIKSALTHMNNSRPSDIVDASAKDNSTHPSALEPLHISGYPSWTPPNTSPMVDSFEGKSGMNILSKEVSNQKLQSTVSKSICKIIELIEGIIQQSSMDYNTQKISSDNDRSYLSYKNSETTTGYTVRVFQWKSTELSAILWKFVHTCTDLLNGKADFGKFAGELTSSLEWIMNHCFSLQDVSSIKDTIKKHFDWDGSRSESELEVGMNSPHSGTAKVYASEERSSCLSSIATTDGQNTLSLVEEIQSDLREENRRLKDSLMNMESAKKDLEGKLKSATDKSETLLIHLQKSEHSIASLETELEGLKESKGMIEDQIENHKLLNEDLDTQLTVARVKLNEAHQKFSSLEVELEDKSNCCEELEATCLELQLQLESVTKKGSPKFDNDQEEKPLRTDWEITAASEKLAECQETILNLGKQLKALASPREAVLLDKVISTNSAVTTTTNTTTKNASHRSSLLDQMLAEDDAEFLKSSKTKEIICTVESQKPPSLASFSSNSIYGSNGQVKSPKTFSDSNVETTAVGALAIVPSKKHRGGMGLFRKLLLKRKRVSTKKTPLPIVA